jgi:hypothetical protein
MSACLLPFSWTRTRQPPKQGNILVNPVDRRCRQTEHDANEMAYLVDRFNYYLKAANVFQFHLSSKTTKLDSLGTTLFRLFRHHQVTWLSEPTSGEKIQSFSKRQIAPLDAYSKQCKARRAYAVKTVGDRLGKRWLLSQTATETSRAMQKRGRLHRPWLRLRDSVAEPS